MTDLSFNPLSTHDFDEIAAAFKDIGWNKPRSQYEKYYQEQLSASRSVIVCKNNKQFVGYVTVIWKSSYPMFQSKSIPEISDLNVLPQFRKNGIGTKLIIECEKLAQNSNHKEIGLGVGLLADYGSAQRLYHRLGYIPDGMGLHYGTQLVEHNQSVKADDDLVIYLSKKI